jgi:scyllo-inositol 2-dehydrogenase (NADP+)
VAIYKKRERPIKTPFKKARDIKVGVVGYGGAFNMGRSHLNQMKAAGMTPVAVCEIDQGR